MLSGRCRVTACQEFKVTTGQDEESKKEVKVRQLNFYEYRKASNWHSHNFFAFLAENYSLVYENIGVTGAVPRIYGLAATNAIKMKLLLSTLYQLRTSLLTRN